MLVPRWAAAVALIGGTLLGCSDAAAPPTARSSAPATVGQLEPSEPFGITAATLHDPDGQVALSLPVYDASTQATRQRGLMHRKSLPSETGMVFRFSQDRTGGFWMKDTLIPLTIAFFDSNGTVVAVRQMEPCTADPCRSYEPGAQYRGALEVTQGFAEQVGIGKGWRVELPAGLPPPE